MSDFAEPLLHRFAWDSYSIGKSQKREDPDVPPRHIDLKPAQAVARRERKGVVIVVPAFTPRDERDPPTVG